MVTSSSDVVIGDLYNFHAQLQVESLLLHRTDDVVRDVEEWSRNANNRLYQNEFNKTNFWNRMGQLFTIERNQRACIAAGVVMAAQYV